MKNALLLLIITTATLCAQTHNDPVTTAIDGYAARVGRHIITYGEIREHAAPLVQHLLQRNPGEELSQQIQEAYLDTREALIEEALIQEETQALGLALPAEVIDEEVNRLILERFDNDRTRLHQALAARRMTFDEWREEVAEQITLRVYYNREITSQANVSTEAIRETYEQTKDSYFIPLRVKFRAILINKGNRAEDQTIKKQQADRILQELLSGANFAEVARRVSEGIRADQGGAFPWSDPADIREELRPALRTVPTGTLSNLIETDGEFYIIQIQERREEGYTPLEDVQREIESELLIREQKRLHTQLMQRLETRHFVKRY